MSGRADSEAGTERFDERKAKAILARAAELRVRREATAKAGVFDLADLRRIAGEAGIDPSLVDEAALELAGRRSGLGAFLLGGKATHKAVRRVEASLDEGMATRLAMELDDLMKTPGHVYCSGENLSWKSDGASSYRDGASSKVSVRREQGDAGRLVVEASVDATNAAGGVFGGIVGGLGFGAGLGVGLGVGISIGSTALAIGGPVAGLALSWLLARWLFSAMSKAYRKRVEATAEAVAAMLENGRSAT